MYNKGAVFIQQLSFYLFILELSSNLVEKNRLYNGVLIEKDGQYYYAKFKAVQNNYCLRLR